ncbi:hypothetical protein OOK41_30050 [Micromonospora sp. NBC_01655]|uniref:hypothetical protein n=1 Tax=Micromonospora sp. NBC_01655 TaxID=2975983 RepID=UPI00225AB457|nr:hypothetical protein [Micromonospora sp. NBC_01655]MCX4474502.1 hypothetical protein [Micromonospora sp. NBC_01655]
MTTPSGDRLEDDYWRRPPAAPGGAAPGPVRPAGAGGAGPAAGYGGPPPSTAPPPGWRPPVRLRVAPPRHLPPQDTTGLDTEEQRAQRVTWSVGGVAAVVLVALVCLLCSRAIF